MNIKNKIALLLIIASCLLMTACVDDEDVRQAISQTPTPAKTFCRDADVIRMPVEVSGRKFVAQVCMVGERKVVAIEHDGSTYYPVKENDVKSLNDLFAKQALAKVGQEEAFTLREHSFTGPFDNYADSVAIYYFDFDGDETKYPSPVGPYVSDRRVDVVIITNAALAMARFN